MLYIKKYVVGILYRIQALSCDKIYKDMFKHFRDDMNFKAVHGTLVVFLQNEAGFQKWGPTTERVKELLLAAKPRESL